MSNNFAPTLPKDRIELLDVLRGLAIVGVLICNIPFFSGYYYTPFTDLEQMSLPYLNSSLITLYLVHFLANFILFFASFLGQGFICNLQRVKKRDF
jgi:uncharacterized protein